MVAKQGKLITSPAGGPFRPSHAKMSQTRTFQVQPSHMISLQVQPVGLTVPVDAN